MERLREKIWVGSIVHGGVSIRLLALGCRSCLVVLIMVEKQLDCLVVFAAVKGNIGSQVGQEALRLLAGGLSDSLVEGGGVVGKPCPVLVSFFKAFLGAFVIFL